MSKLREDSTWNQLTAGQRETLEDWLFEENLGYEKTLARAKQEFGLEATMASLGRYYRRRAGERQVQELVEAQLAADELNGIGITAPRLREAALKLVGKAALKVATEKPTEVQQLVSLTKLLLESDAHDIQRERQKLAENHFQLSQGAASRKNEPHSRSLPDMLGNNDGKTITKKFMHPENVLSGVSSEKPVATGEAVCDEDLKVE
jgi:hypothetical protein